MSERDSRLPWVCCDGGPHLLLPTQLIGAWEGVDEPSGGRMVEARFRYAGDSTAAATDYDLACDVEGVLGVIPVGSGHGLVLGGEVPMTTWLPSPRGTGIDLVVPLEWGSLADEVLERASCNVPPAMLIDTGLTLDIGAEGATLLAACDLGPDWMYATVAIPLRDGRYSVATCDYDGEPDHIIRIHRLFRSAWQA